MDIYKKKKNMKKEILRICVNYKQTSKFTLLINHLQNLDTKIIYQSNSKKRINIFNASLKEEKGKNNYF